MLFNVYLFCFIVGGVFVGLSMISGAGDVAGGELDAGADMGADAEAELDADFGAEAELDADPDVGADTDFDADVGADGGAMELSEIDFDLEAAGLEGEVDADTDAQADGTDYERRGSSPSFNPFLSFKFYTFFMAFFGMTGLIFEGLGLWASANGILALSAGMGAFAGLSMSYLIHQLKMSEETVRTNQQYIGASAEVTVPIERDTGKVRIQLDGQTVDMRARAFDRDDTFEQDETCFVLDVEDEGIARVVSVDEVRKRLV